MKKFLLFILLAFISCKKDQVHQNSSHTLYSVESRWGNLETPREIAVTSSFVFIMDESYILYKFTHSGTLISQWDLINSTHMARAEFTVFKEELYVVSTLVDSVIQVYDLNLNLKRNISLNLSTASYISDIEICDSVALFTYATFDAPYLMKVNLLTGKAIELGTTGSGELEFSSEIHNAVCSFDTLFYITDKGNYRVQVLSNRMNHLADISITDSFLGVYPDPDIIDCNNDYIFIGHFSHNTGRVDILSRKDYSHILTFSTRKSEDEKTNNIGIRSFGNKLFILSRNTPENVTVYKK